jgi:ribosomal protein L11 methyltransferase
MTVWKEYRIHINKEAEESVSEILINLGSAGVNIVDRADFETLPEYGFDTLWELNEEKFPSEGVIVNGYFDLEQITPDFEKNLHQKLEQLKEMTLDIEDYTVESNEIADSDWNENWKEFYHSVQVTRYLTIVPEWEDYQNKRPDEQLIVLDPGLAFGTGTHPTTQLCIQALETILRGDEVILDVGTGSGVLTIASSLLGAKEIYAYDLDEMAVQAAKNNIALNDLATEITVKENNLLKDVTIEADVVVANILAGIVMELIPDAMKVLKPGGFFVSSGIITEQQEQVLGALEAEGFKLVQINQMKDWIVIVAQKPTAADKLN